MKPKVLLYLFFLIFIPTKQTKAQKVLDYKTAIGARFGSPYISLSYKTFLTDRQAVEVYGSFQGFTTHNWKSITGAYQYHLPLNKLISGIKSYSGAGLSTYFWSFDSNFQGDNSAFTVGLNGYIGLDYKIPSAPITFSGDWVPTYFINGYNVGFGIKYWSFGIRYILK